MSMIYDNIKAICKHHGIKISYIEFPRSAGSISRFEAQGKIDELPIYMLRKLSQESGVPIDDIVKKDISYKIDLDELREQIESLKKREADIERRETENEEI